MNCGPETACWSTASSCQTEEYKSREIAYQTKDMMKNEKKDPNENKPLPKSKVLLELEKNRKNNEKELVDKDDELRELRKLLKD